MAFMTPPSRAIPPDRPQMINGTEPVQPVTTPDSTDSATSYNLPEVPVYYMMTGEQAEKSGRFNPPPHKVSRSFPPIAYPSGAGKDPRTNAQRVLQSRKLRGFIYQDFDTQQPQKKKSELWGFQFMYNPNTFSYSNNVNPNLDVTNPDAFTANLLTGVTTGTLELYLNRVFDIATMRDMGGPAAFPATGFGATSGYGKYVGYPDLLGIYTRGTEWDLEYLYRVVNGDPVRNPTMLNNLHTSDFGFLASTPVWLKLHNNLRWKISLTGITVQHGMFTQDMIPILTQVSIGFMRLPVIQDTTSGSNALLTGRFEDKLLGDANGASDTSGQSTN